MATGGSTGGDSSVPETTRKVAFVTGITGQASLAYILRSCM